MELDKIKQNISAVLKHLKLSDMVLLEEIEGEISRVDTTFQSLLLLGILRRIMDSKDDQMAKIFIPAVTAWKNYLPHKELSGLTPDEYRKKYPTGQYETGFLSELMDQYQTRLESKTGTEAESFNVETDFNAFQDEYFNRVPLDQPFINPGEPLMNIKRIIIEERRRGGVPKKMINKIGVKIFAENTAEGAGEKMAKIDDAYLNALEELSAMQMNPELRSRARVCAMRKLFERDEPYHRCGPSPHQFYFNYAMVVFLDEDNPKFVISLIDRSLSCKPDYKPAIEMKGRLR